MWLESNRDIEAEQERLKEITPKEERAHLKGLGRIPKRTVREGQKRGGINQVRRYEDRTSKLRNLTRNDGPSPHTRKNGEASTRSKSDDLANKRVPQIGTRKAGK